MNGKLKNIILSVSSFVMVFSVLYVPVRIDNSREMKKVGFGYPFEFVYQDFSPHLRGFQFYPRYERFKFDKEFPIVYFSFLRFILSWLVFFVILKAIIRFLEFLKFKLSNRSKQEKQKF